MAAEEPHYETLCTVIQGDDPGWQAFSQRTLHNIPLRIIDLSGFDRLVSQPAAWRSTWGETRFLSSVATSVGVVRLVLGQGGRLAVVGIALGLAGAAGRTRFLGSMLFGIERFDAVTFAGAAVVIGAVAIVACIVPAFRGARVDPVTALRQE